MQEWIQQREARLREYFGLNPDAVLLQSTPPQLPSDVAAHLLRFNFEWHLIPSREALPFDDEYVARMYPMRSPEFGQPHLHGPSYHEVLAQGHSRFAGRVVAVETTQKPRYLPGNRQYYGTQYGFDATTDPFAIYMGYAGFTSGTRYGHNYAALKKLGDIISDHWRAQNLLPQGYRVALCPPDVFNLIGNVFHPEWSATETLELGFYRDAHDNATCYAVGCNAPGDFSFIRALETSSDWTLLGFRAALLPV